MCGPIPAHRLLPAAAWLAAVVCLAPATGAQTTPVAGARLVRDGLPARMPEAAGGGESAVELTLDRSGAVTQIRHLRVTPPYSELVSRAVSGWIFDRGPRRPAGTPARRVLVVGVFRPPTTYAGPAPGTPPETRARISPVLPEPETLSMPPYPPDATGDGLVLVELELNAKAEVRSHQVVSPPSGFDGAALEAVKTWRFAPPQSPDAPDPLYVYAVVGFKTPVVAGGAR